MAGADEKEIEKSLFRYNLFFYVSQTVNNQREKGKEEYIPYPQK